MNSCFKFSEIQGATSVSIIMLRIYCCSVKWKLMQQKNVSICHVDGIMQR